MYLRRLFTILGLMTGNYPKFDTTQCLKSPPRDSQQIANQWYGFATLSPKYDEGTVIECFIAELAPNTRNIFDMRLQIEVNGTKEYLKNIGFFYRNEVLIVDAKSNGNTNGAIEILNWKDNELLVIRERNEFISRAGIFSREIKPSFNIAKLLKCLSPRHRNVFRLVNNTNCQIMMD